MASDGSSRNTEFLRNLLGCGRVTNFAQFQKFIDSGLIATLLLYMVSIHDFGS